MTVIEPPRRRWTTDEFHKMAEFGPAFSEIAMMASSMAWSTVSPLPCTVNSSPGTKRRSRISLCCVNQIAPEKQRTVIPCFAPSRLITDFCVNSSLTDCVVGVAGASVIRARTLPYVIVIDLTSTPSCILNMSLISLRVIASLKQRT